MRQGQGRHRLPVGMELDDLAEVEVGQGIAADDQKWLIEHIFGILHAARGAKWNLFTGVVDMHTNLRPVAKIVFDGAGHVLHGDNDVGDSMALEQIEDMLHDRATHNWHHRFRTRDGQWSQSRALAASHHYSFHNTGPPSSPGRTIA